MWTTFFDDNWNQAATLLHSNDRPWQGTCGLFFCAVVITAECSAQKLRKEKMYKMYKLIPAELISAHIPHGSPLGMALREAIATQMALGYPR